MMRVRQRPSRSVMRRTPAPTRSRTRGSAGPTPRGAPPAVREMPTQTRRLAGMLLVLDNYDSFTYNLVQYAGELGADPMVHRNDALRVTEALALEPTAILISP